MDYQDMKRRAAALLAVLLFAMDAYGMEQYARPLQDQNGKAISGATVTVFIGGTTTLAQIYSDNGITAKQNPFTTGINGLVAFYAANGMYDISVVSPRNVFPAEALKGISLFDEAEGAAGQASSITGSDTLPEEPCMIGQVYAENNEGNATFYFCPDGTWKPVGTQAATSLQAVADVGRTIGNATSDTTAVAIGSSADDEFKVMFRDPTLGLRITCRIAGVLDNCNKATMVKSSFRFQITDQSGETLFNFDPNASTPNARYALGTLPTQSTFEVPLQPRGAASVVTESLTTDHTVSRYLTVTDSNSDAVDFEFHVTNRMAGATTLTFRLYGVSTAASPSGNIALDCATTAYTPGTDTYGTHSATGAVRATLTPATQYRPVAVTTSSHTINGGPIAAGDMVRGSCVVHATDTTSAQMANFRLHGRVAITMTLNSLSD